jgi:NAD(P)-dependent dehydrogenase (short-subunit alcohol dehydrogenase family)
MTSSLSSSNQKVAVVTGSSSGIGFETSLTLARSGFLTYATMRNLGKGASIKSVAAKEGLPIRVAQLDVTEDRSINDAVHSIISDVGKIDVLVNNAGYGLNGAFEDLAMEEIKVQFETTLFGVMRVTQAVLPIMRKQKSGIIVNISAAGGRFGIPGASANVSTKFTIEGLSESMSYELELFGIKVVLIEPGLIKTNFVNNIVAAKKSQDPNSPYAQFMQDVATSFQHMLGGGSSSDVVAKVVLEAVTTKNPSLRYLAGKDMETWMEAKTSMSDEEFHNMMKQNLMK